MRILLSFIGLLCVMLLVSPAQAQQWGDVTFQFTYDGTPPTPQPVTITKDQAFCGKHNVIDESLVVNPSNRGVKDVVVFIYVGRRGKQPPVHPSYEQSANDVIKLDNANCRFEPHVTMLRTSQTLEVGNSDPVGHNSNFSTFSNPSQNLLIPAGRSEKLNFPNPESRLPAAQVSCNIHPWMKGWLVIKSHPYMGASDKDGKLTLKNVPAGKWTFQIWQEKAGYVSEAKVGGKATKWSKGRMELTVKPGQNDLGEIKLPASLFAK